MTIGLLQPAWLILLLVVPAAWFIPRPVKDVRHGVLRSLALALVALALARPVSWSDGGAEHHVVILDISASVNPADIPAARSVTASLRAALPDNANCTLVLLGTDSTSDLGSGYDGTILLADSGSPLGDAIEIAAQRIPEGSPGSVILVSDGQATDGQWDTAVRDLADRGVPLHTLALQARDDPRPVQLATRGLQVGAVGRIFISVAGQSSAPMEVTVTGPGGIEARARVRAPGHAVVEIEPKQSGFLRLQAQVGPAPHQVISRTFPVQDPVRVLYLGHRMREGGPRLMELAGSGFDVEVGPTDGPPPTEGIDGFDLVVVDDRPASTLPTATQEAMIDAVNRHGLGLLVSGGGQSFGAGGYHDSPLSKVLPVSFVHKEEKKDPSTALALIIDTSGSMTGNRIRIAKEVSRLAIRRLLPHDKVGIVEFFGNKRWAAPLQSAANAIDIQRALNRLDAGGGTILLPAVEEAYYGLKNVQTRYKHVMLLTDAGVETGPYESLMRRMARDGICVSTILCGPGRHSEFLVQLSDWGNGRYYNANNRFNLPEILLKQPSTSRLPSYRPGSHGLEPRAGSGWWGSVDPKTIPPLAGYVESKARPGADVVLRTQTEKHPVLVSWRTGLGRVTTFMSEPAGTGTEPWAEWEGYGPFMARLMRRTASDQRMPFRFELRRRDHELTLWAWRRTRDAALPQAARLDPDGKPTTDLVFHERADGVFTADLVAAPDADVRIVAGTDSGPRHGMHRLVSDAGSDRAAERQVDPETSPDLGRLATATGGVSRKIGDAEALALPSGGGDRPITGQGLWPWCLLLALLAYIADIVWRRSPWRRPVRT